MWQYIQSSPIDVPSNVKVMEEFLQNIHSKDIRLKKDDVKIYNKSLRDIVSETLTSEMKKDEVFKALFKTMNFSGSFYEKLRVKTPNEFDLNLLLQLPKEFRPIKPVNDFNVEPGFVRLKVFSTLPPPGNSKVHQKVLTFLDAENFLWRDKVLRWLQSVVDTALMNITWDTNPRITVQRSTSGPAITLTVKIRDIDRREYSVDLVPVFSFTEDSWPGPPIRKLTSNMDLQWSIVPKGPSCGDLTQWRMSFYNHEKKLMEKYENMKPTIKILKLLRDKENWKGLSSYYIKTVFLWEQACKEDTPLFWRRSMSYLFYHMLCVLENCLAKNCIPFFWHGDCNLLQYSRTTTTNDWANRISTIRRAIDRRLADPEDLGRYINCIFKRENQVQLVREDSEEDLPIVLARQQLQQQQQVDALGSDIAIGLAAGIGILSAGIAGLLIWQRNRRQE